MLSLFFCTVKIYRSTFGTNYKVSLSVPQCLGVDLILAPKKIWGHIHDNVTTIHDNYFWQLFLTRKTVKMPSRILYMTNKYYHCNHHHYHCHSENQCHLFEELFFVWFLPLLTHPKKQIGWTMTLCLRQLIFSQFDSNFLIFFLFAALRFFLRILVIYFWSIFHKILHGSSCSIFVLTVLENSWYGTHQ